MSAAATAPTGRAGESGTWAPAPARIFLSVFSLGVVAVLASWAIADWRIVQPLLTQMLLWAALAVLGDFLVVEMSDRITLTMSLPVTLAAAMVLPPVCAGILAFVASADLREFKGEIQLERGVFNRSQVATSVTAAACVFHAFGIPTSYWPLVLFPAALAVGVDCVTNLALVSIAAGLIQGTSPRGVLRRLVTDAPMQYVFTYCALGLLALLMATVAGTVGMWGAAAFLVPLALARQTMVEAQRSRRASESSNTKERALRTVCQRIVDERLDERFVVAGELHDEILPPLFKVHLLAQVLKQDLSSGRLLSLDEDLPELVEATKIAQDAVRILVGDLRRSSLGPGGMNATIRARAEELETLGSARIRLDLDVDSDVSRLCQLLAYQVAREAMTNAARHSRASVIRVRSRLDGDVLRLLITDDGVGFDPLAAGRRANFGSLQLIEELVEAARGRMDVDSRLGVGTTVSVVLPLDA
jgi:signal transduction histidine kinase